jgi:hypothetical protein
MRYDQSYEEDDADDGGGGATTCGSCDDPLMKQEQGMADGTAPKATKGRSRASSVRGRSHGEGRRGAGAAHSCPLCRNPVSAVHQVWE